MTEEKRRLLVIDDEAGVRDMLERILGEQGFEVTTAVSGREGIDRYAADPADLVLLDIKMPEMDGFAVLERLRVCDPEALVIIMTGHGSIESVVRAMKLGASDYLSKPLDLEHLEIVLDKALRGRSQSRELELLRQQLVQQGSFEGLVGVSPPMQRLYDLVRRLAASDTTVLVQGETGTGKELVARAIHNLSPRRERGFMAINCGALPETILESELFGHEKGAFTGAVRLKYGLIEQAEGGTLFLDEIEAMSPALQVKLLRAIQEREVLRVGGERPLPVDFRLVAAANVDLRTRMEAEEFRADLFYRLSVVAIELPPLRERPGDIPLLAEYFLRRYAERNERSIRGFNPEGLQLLQAYGWPGNVRELESAVEQAVVLSKGEWIESGDLPDHLTAVLPKGEGNEWLDMPFKKARDEFERRYFEYALERAEGVVAKAARLADIPRQYFYEKMKRHGIQRL